MIPRFVRSFAIPYVMTFALAPYGAILHAVQPPASAPARVEPAPVEPRLVPEQAERSAEDTRRALEQVLEQYPPSLTQVLRLDPSLLTNDGYLSSYPTLRAYLAAHPEIAHNPSFFVGHAGFNPEDRDPRSRALQAWERMFETLAVLLGFALAFTGLAWLLKSLIDHRRWLRVSKVQADVHAKLMDRLTNNEDLLTYIQSSAGRRFLESAPIDIEAAPRALSAPLNRILLSVQAGFVLGFAGLGLQWASTRVAMDAQEPVFVLGTVTLMLGAGFVASAAAAYVMSRRIGLLDPASPADRPTDVR